MPNDFRFTMPPFLRHLKRISLTSIITCVIFILAPGNQSKYYKLQKKRLSRETERKQLKWNGRLTKVTWSYCLFSCCVIPLTQTSHPAIRV